MRTSEYEMLSKIADQNSKLKIFLQTGKDPGRAARDGGEVRRRLAVRPHRLQVPYCPQYHHYLCPHCIVLTGYRSALFSMSSLSLSSLSLVDHQ